MGNQLVGIAPSQIYPVEHYFTGSFECGLQFDSSMGSTRFFKVARAKSDEGLVVVKVFVKHDPTLPLESHAERIEFIKKTLSNAVNCLPFQKVILNEKAGFIIRQYVKHSLYDRVSTRPFLTILEKKWISFQILCALNQCHKQKICHGDIKLENILITSWNWVLLSDFASFKPTYLPEDNPADYNYFFDTSRRRTCYIAPERFVKTFSSDNITNADIPLMSDSILPEESLIKEKPNSRKLLPEMDIFSGGCALLELWTEGTAPFELSQILLYRNAENEVNIKHLHNIEDINLKNLISSMLERNPKLRKSAEIYLDEERGRLFPEYFYSFLQSYLQMFSSLPLMSADDKINRLHSDIEHCIEILQKRSDTSVDNEKKDINNEEIIVSEEDGLILIITVVTSCIRGLHYTNTKLNCLEILQKLAENTISEIILDRIVPYVLHLTQDSSSRVQAFALDTLTNCLGMVKNIPRSDVNVFPEYILPGILPLATDSSTIVRVSYARNIAKLSETSVFFLDQTHKNNPIDMPMPRYEAELNALHEVIQQTVLSLLTDSETIVKQTLIESGIKNLCVFFGKQKANDLILSHMITFLNDKEDKNLRGSFFDCIVGVVAYIGWQLSDILIPLLHQGLTDSEEFVITKAIQTTTHLTEIGLIQKSAITDFISESACYLCHPNLWIRHEICGLISTTAKVLTKIDVQCKIMPSIAKYLRTPIIQIEKPEIILDCLNPPIPRSIFDNVLRFPEIDKFISYLEQRKEASLSTGTTSIQYEMETPLKHLIRRLTSEGLTELVETQLLSMKFYLTKLCKYKNQEPKQIENGRIILQKKDILCHEYSLIDKCSKIDGGTRKIKKSDCELTSNVEWQHIYGIVDSQLPSVIANESVSPVIIGGNPGPSSALHPTPSSLIEYSLPEKSCTQERISDCRIALEKLRHKIKMRYAISTSNRDYNPLVYYSSIPSSWRMNGILVAHLHEHNQSIVKMAALKPFGPIFATGSIDGTVRLWDCNKLNGHLSINRSRQVYSANTPIYSLAACDSGQSLAVGGKDGSLLIMRIDRNSTKMTLQQALHMNQSGVPDSDSNVDPVVDMQTLDQNVIIFATLYGEICAWDLRIQNTAWKLKNELRHGVITSICAHPSSAWLATGTSGGKHICWDLRFNLPIAEIRHPYDSWIRKVACHPNEPSSLISASQGNNEVSIWNIETGHRQVALWSSAAPPLSNTSNLNPSSICAILTGLVDGSSFILTGSSDQRIRYWNLSKPKFCSMIVPSSKDNLADISFSYESRLIDGTRVIYEIIDTIGTTTSRNSEEQPPRSGPEMPSTSHFDAITDLLMCRTEKQQTFIVSSGRDGVVKLWK